MNRAARRAQRRQKKQGTSPCSDRGQTIRLAMDYLAQSPTATSATMITSDGSVTHLDANDARAVLTGLQPKGRA